MSRRDLNRGIATWFHRESVRPDALRPFMGCTNRSTTDGHTAVIRLETGKVLSNMPRLEILKRKSPDR